MAYEWDTRRARRARFIRLVAAVAIGAPAIAVPVAVLLAAAPIWRPPARPIGGGAI